jgi:hypothetical protein
VPEPLVRRLVRFNLVDNVRGQTVEYEDEHVRRARITSRITGVDGKRVTLRLEGETRSSAEGMWSVAGYRDMDNPTPQKRGFETQVLGFAEYDTERERFVRFEMLAVGTRWGGTTYNGRSNDLEPNPIGVAFTLAGDSPAERVAPAHLRDYGWPRR